MKSVKHLLIAIALLLLTTSAAYAQQSATPTPNSANSDAVVIQGCQRALDEVKAARPLIQELQIKSQMADETIAAYKLALEAAKGLVAAKDEVIAAKNETISLQGKLIEKHEARIQKLEKRGSGGKLKAVLPYLTLGLLLILK